MIKKLIQHGNSAALIIDKPILELLKIDMDTPIELITDGKNLIISPVDKTDHETKINKSLEKINKKHHHTLKKLAD
ncbi:MAG: AbrB/MazE/SpoVT family DNA-binding domain-containing protein [Spirochaetes bacterium]|nr:AbrB/MazE/SpoVT family DNA-binding domain-containing protein [Spirochaetota bacterium]